MNWLVPALYNVAALSIYYIFLQGSNTYLTNDFASQFVYGCSVLIIAGFTAILILFYFYIQDATKIHNLFYKKIKIIDILVPGILAPTIIISNILALSKGGGISISVINLNMIVILLAGAYLYKDKINLKIIISILFGIASISYAVNESISIN